MQTILIVDDDKNVRSGLVLVLRHAGYAVEQAATQDEALNIVRNQCPALILLDMNFSPGSTSGTDGIAMLRRIKILKPQIPVILITAWGSIPLAVEGIKYGAFDFITKPWNNLALLQSISTALELSEPDDAREVDFDRSFIIGKSKALNDVLEIVRRIAPTDASVLITGENGTGKELIARALHVNSRRCAKPFVMVNLGGIPGSLFESEMFGYAKGAFTGAYTDRKGRFESADKGTIFLDEIGELDLNSQVKMLRVLQERTFERLGESRSRGVDVRVISATNADLPSMLAEHTFREDLFYRINTIVIKMPALRERREDIPALVSHFATAHGGRAEFTSEAMEYLCRLTYPGNVRQLKNIVDRAMLVCDGSRIGLDDVSGAYEAMPAVKDTSASNAGKTLEQLEYDAVVAALEKHSGNLTDAALELGITRQSLYRRMEKYRLR